MALTGACSNGQVGDELGRVNKVRRQLLGRREVRVVARYERPARPQPIQQTVLAVLADARGPLRAIEIAHRVGLQLDGEVSWGSVKNALSDLARAENSNVLRVGHGRYQLRKA